ncbi:hypothetical protein ACO2Q8_05410 [Larkinella sp. VNQ87]|uniref:hypothetical protein n=1 Tax=Larkinella sp. VNQ87 TaxID=3400921 RepID=UPI003C009767
MKNNLKIGNRSLTVGLGIVLTAFCLSCGSKTESNQTNGDSAEAAADTSIMGIQGDTTTNTLDAPQSAQGDTGQTLPEMRAKVKQ